VRDRHLDEGDQELGRRPSIIRRRLHCVVQAAAADRAAAAPAPHARANSLRSKRRAASADRPADRCVLFWFYGRTRAHPHAGSSTVTPHLVVASGRRQ
jgi:hypothetical protein